MALEYANYVDASPKDCNYKWAEYVIANGPKNGPNRLPYDTSYQQRGYMYQAKVPRAVMNEHQHNVQRQLDWAVDGISELDSQEAKNASDISGIRTAPNEFVVPLGGIIMWAVDTIPTGYVLCDGREVSRTDTKYKALFAIIGTRYGFSSPTTFKLPDYRGRFLRGTDRGRGLDPHSAIRQRGGDTLGSTQYDMFSRHKHTTYLDKLPIASPNGPNHRAEWDASHGEETRDTKTDKFIKSTGIEETRPVNIAVDYIIKITT